MIIKIIGVQVVCGFATQVEPRDQSLFRYQYMLDPVPLEGFITTIDKIELFRQLIQ